MSEPGVVSMTKFRINDKDFLFSLVTPNKVGRFFLEETMQELLTKNLSGVSSEFFDCGPSIVPRKRLNQLCLDEVIF